MTNRILQNIIFTILFIPLLKPAHAQEPFVPVEGMWIPDGVVNDFKVIDDIMYIGGNFFNVGPYTGSPVAIDRETHELTNFFPRVEAGFVAEIVRDGSGGWFVAGDFLRIGGVEQKCLAHVLPDGSVDLNWRPELDTDEVTGISLFDSMLYLAVVRNDVIGPNGSRVDRIISIDAATGEQLNWTADLDGYTLGFTVADSGVYVGGIFTVTRGATTWQNLVEFDRTTGEPTDWNPQPDDYVYIVEVIGDQLLVGGKFHSIGGSSRNYIAALDRSTGLATEWAPAVNDATTNIQVADQAVYISGHFTEMNGEPRNFAGAVDLTSGGTLEWNPNLLNLYGVRASLPFTFTESSVFVAGYQHSEPGEGVAFIETDRVTGELKSFFPGGGFTTLNQILVEGDLLILSGGRQVFEGVSRVGLAAIDLNTGLPTDWDPGINARAWNMEIFGSTMLVSALSEHSFANEQLFWAIDIPTGNVIPDMNIDTDGRIGSIKRIGDSLYVSGYFSTVNGQPRTNFAEFDLTDFALTDFNPQPDNDVESYLEENGVVYIGGDFTEFDSMPRTGLAAFDQNTRELTDWSPALSAFAGVYQMEKKNGNLYIGGFFQTVNTLERNGLASFSLETGELNSWNPGDTFGRIRIGLYDDLIFVSGAIPSYGFENPRYVRAYDIDNGEDRTDEIPSFNQIAFKMGQVGDEFFVSGYFNAVNGRGMPILARFRRGVSSEGWVIH